MPDVRGVQAEEIPGGVPGRAGGVRHQAVHRAQVSGGALGEGRERPLQSPLTTVHRVTSQGMIDLIFFGR